MFGRRARAALSIASLAVAVPLVSVTPAVAAEGCGGNLVKLLPLHMPDGTRIGELQIYFNPDTGYNCAEMHHGGPTWGVSRDTWVYIAKCETTQPTGTCFVADDDYTLENVAYWAGPVRVHAGGHCIQANGWIYWQGARRKVATDDTVLCGT
jgi:hypothetical protein